MSNFSDGAAKTTTTSEMENVMLPIALHPESCAVIYDEGIIIDEAFNWETAENFAAQGYEVVAVDHDLWINPFGKWIGKTKQEIQQMCDARLADYNDCFGVN